MACDCCGDCDDRALLQLFCGWCRSRFCVCESCYRGDGYCGRPCRASSQAKIDRDKQRRYRATPAGRENHRERSCFSRERAADAAAAGVGHPGIRKLDASVDCAPPDVPVAPILGDSACDGGSVADDVVHGDHQAESGPGLVDPDAGRGRAVEGLSPTARDGLVLQACEGAARESGGLAGCSAPRCMVCGRASRWLVSGSHRRPRDRASHRVLRRGAHRAQAPPPSGSPSRRR